MNFLFNRTLEIPHIKRYFLSWRVRFIFVAFATKEFYKRERNNRNLFWVRLSSIINKRFFRGLKIFNGILKDSFFYNFFNAKNYVPFLFFFNSLDLLFKLFEEEFLILIFKINNFFFYLKEDTFNFFLNFFYHKLFMIKFVYLFHLLMIWINLKKIKNGDLVSSC